MWFPLWGLFMIWAMYVFPLFALKKRYGEEQNNRPVKSTMTKEMLTILAFTLSPLSLPPSPWCPHLDTPAHPSTSAALPGQLEELANKIFMVHGIQHFKATEPCCNKENVCLDTEMLMCVYKETILREEPQFHMGSKTPEDWRKIGFCTVSR